MRNLLLKLSLLLFLTTAILWLRSYHRCDLVWWFSERPDMDGGVAISLVGHGLHVGSAHGSLWCAAGRMEVITSVFDEYERNPQWLSSELTYHNGEGLAEMLNSNTPARGRLGFGAESGRRPWVRGGQLGTRVVVPHWFLAVLFMVLPSLRMTKHWRTRASRAEGICPICGYDLRATPARCPECGTHAMQNAETLDLRTYADEQDEKQDETFEGHQRLKYV